MKDAKNTGNSLAVVGILAKVDALNRMGFKEPGAYRAKEKELFMAIDKLVKESGQGVVGKHIKFSVADGYAHYLITRENRSTVDVVHLPIGDGYELPGVVNGKLMKKVALREIANVAVMKKIFKEDENAAFYQNLKPGQIVHYHNGFQAYVRCQVTPEKTLVPIALVGAWREFDLPRRNHDGSITYGYHAEKIQEGKTMTPHISTIWEYTRNGASPALLVPICLQLPPMTAEQEIEAKKYQKRNQIEELMNENIHPDVLFQRLKKLLD